MRPVGRGAKEAECDLVGAGFRREGQIRVEAFVEDSSCVAGAGGQFRLSPFAEGWKMLFAEAVQTRDNPEIEAHFAEPGVLLLRRRANLLGRAGKKLKMAGLNLVRSQSDGALQTIGQGLSGDRDPHRPPLANRELHQGRYRYRENE